MTRKVYSIRQNGRDLSVCIPREVAVSLGIQDMEGNLLSPVVSMHLSPDRSSVTMKPEKI